MQTTKKDTGLMVAKSILPRIITNQKLKNKVKLQKTYIIEIFTSRNTSIESRFVPTDDCGFSSAEQRAKQLSVPMKTNKTFPVIARDGNRWSKWENGIKVAWTI